MLPFIKVTLELVFRPRNRGKNEMETFTISSSNICPNFIFLLPTKYLRLIYVLEHSFRLP